jgi:hypothetical protein
MNTTRKTLTTRYGKITAQADAIQQVATPLRERRDALKQRHAAELASLNADIRKAEQGLFDIEQERAQIAIALGGRVLG